MNQLIPAVIQCQVVFPHIISDEYIVSVDGGLEGKKKVDIEKLLSGSNMYTFKNYLINSKREMLLMAIPAEHLRKHLRSMDSSLGLACEDGNNMFFSSYIKWSVYFLDSMNELSKSTKEIDASPQGGVISASFYLDKARDVFLACLPFEVEFKGENRIGEDHKCKVGIMISYDLSLVREKVFKYTERDNFANYLIEVQNKTNKSMTENISYVSREIEIRNPLSVHSSFIRSSSDVYIKFYLKNEMLHFSHDETVSADSMIGKYMNNTQGNSPTDYYGLYTQSMDNFQLKIESSVNQGMDTKILNEYLTFLDYQLVNTNTNTVLRPGESYSIMYKISRRELLKYKKNKTMIYAESPLVKQIKGKDLFTCR